MSKLNSVLHNRVHAESYGTKTLFAATHLAAIVAALYLTKDALHKTRVQACFIAIGLYFVRHMVTLFYLLQRKIPLEEVGMVGSFLALWVPGSAYLAMTADPPTFLELAISAALVLFGSFLNTYSELQRKWWKTLPENKGKCYTEGLWTYAVHVNYSGDVVLFTGWALLTGYSACLILPAMMAYNFSYMQGPELDAYLANRYKEQFANYLANTGYLFPRVW